MPKKITYDDNHIRFLDERNDVATCPTCNVATHPFCSGFPNQAIPNRCDISHCFEGFALASPRLKTFLETQCSSPIEFHETGGGHFILRPVWSVFEDFTATYLEHDDYCESCGRFNSCYGVPSGILKGQRRIGPLDLVRTAHELGPKGQKNFHLIVGDELAVLMQAETFTDLTYLEYADEFVAAAVLGKAAALHKGREYARSAHLYQEFIDDFASGVPHEADRNYLVAYAQHHRYTVGRKIGRKHYPEISQDHLEAVARTASGVCLAKFPVPPRVV